MSIIIRPSLTEDAKQVSPLIYEAIGEIANRLTGETDASKILKQLEVLFRRKDNRHSYLNTYVAVRKDNLIEVLGILVLYSGEDAMMMDSSLQKWLENKGAPIIQIDQEAYLDEFYVDTICVHEQYRGLGIGTKLLQFAEEVAHMSGFSKLSLNVETEKIEARRLYERVGYITTEQWTIIDEPFYHMVKTIL